MDVEVAVVEVNVPAQGRHDQRQSGGKIDQLQERRIVPEHLQQVQRPVLR